MNNPLFSFANQAYTQKDLMTYINKYPSKFRTTEVQEYVDLMFAEFSNQELMKYEEEHLEDKYPEFKYLMQEYHDGILLFELTDKMVWSKAIKDSLGLQEFYEENKMNYLWDDRIEATIYICKNDSRLKELTKILKKRTKKGYTDEDLLSMFNKENNDYLSIEKGTFSKGDNKILDSLKWNTGMTGNLKQNGKPVFVSIHKVLKNQPKSLTEAKGVITSDYQDHLEHQWIEELREKYPVQVNTEVLGRIRKTN